MKDSYGHSYQVLQNFQPFVKKFVLVGYDAASAVPEVSNDCTRLLDHLRQRTYVPFKF
jgi:hypothetical protein